MSEEALLDPVMVVIAEAIDRDAYTIIEELRIWAVSQQDIPRKMRVLVSARIKAIS
jgi:hypothetical protein